MIILMMGPPGSGKGTYAQMLSKEGWIHFSIGQELRNHVAHNEKHATVLSSLLDKGKMAPNKIVMDVVDSFFKKHEKNNIVLDGFPRTIEQVSFFEELLKKNSLSVAGVVLLELDKKTILNRLTSRVQCSSCGKIFGVGIASKKKGWCDSCGGKLVQRKDDTIEVAEERLKVYEKETLPVIRWAVEKYSAVTIDGLGSPEGVFIKVKEAIQSFSG